MNERDTEVTVHPTAVIEAGVLLGPGVSIWHFAHVRQGAVLGPGVSLGKSVFVDSGVTIGGGCRIQNFVSIYRGVTLEEDVFVGPSVTFTNDPEPRANKNDWILLPTVVRRGASLGANATVLPGVEIGAWAMVAAGAVVTGDVEEHRLVVGVPATPQGWVCWCGRRIDEKPVPPCSHRPREG
jgi:UDP-2-acetamido-3-amino-2,3-dideoxy-glucuronate N-acetyltransferase